MCFFHPFLSFLLLFLPLSHSNTNCLFNCVLLNHYNSLSQSNMRLSGTFICSHKHFGLPIFTVGPFSFSVHRDSLFFHGNVSLMKSNSPQRWIKMLVEKANKMRLLEQNGMETKWDILWNILCYISHQVVMKSEYLGILNVNVKSFLFVKIM